MSFKSALSSYPSVCPKFWVKSLISGRLIGCENFDFGEVFGQFFLDKIQYLWVHRTSKVCVCCYLQPGTINAGSVLAK